MTKIIDQQFKVYNEVKVVGMTQIEQDGDGYRSYLLLRFPPAEEFYRKHGGYHVKFTDAQKWCREKLTEEHLRKLYELEEITNKAMAEFYSNENRSKYLYNE